MEDAVAAQARERVTRWIAESRELLGLLPVLLTADHKSEQADRDSDRLRKDAEALRKEIADLRKETGELRTALDELQKQNEILRAEKEEAAGAFAKLLDTVQSTNQIAQKLGMTKSPFARQPASAATPAASAANIPNPAPHE